MKRRSLLSVTLASMIGVGSILASSPVVSASTLSELQNQQKNIQNQKSNLKTNIYQKDMEITRIEGEKNQVEIEVHTLETTINETNAKIIEKQQQIKDTEAEIALLKEEIEELKKRIEERNELLKQRARAMQTNGGSGSYIDVLLGASSFGDFIDRFTAVTTLVNADKQIMEEHQKDKEDVEKKQAEVESKLKELQSMLSDLENMKAELDQQKARKNELMQQLELQKQHFEGEKLSLEEEQRILGAQDAALQEAIKSEKSRIAEEERQRRLAAERQAAARRSSGGGGPVSSVPQLTPGIFTRPTEGTVTSEFGRRSGGMHYGIDIAKRGTVPVVAAADGVVFRSEQSSSYGNVIYITHNIDGQVYTTVYAHLSQRNVTSGSVSKGEVIGYMGNTGNSTGQHLHFEIYEGEWTSSKSNAVNPRNYVSF